MIPLRVWLCRLRGLFARRRRDAELREEIETHLELLAEGYQRNGMSSAEARAAARRAFGGVEQAKEAYRDRRGLPFVDALIQDVRYAMRTLAKNPGFTAVAILTLALGIGANTAIFSVVNAVLVSALPFPHADRLVWVSTGRSSPAQGPLSPPDFVDYRDRNTSLVHAGAYATFLQPHSWVLNGSAQQLQGAMITADLFEALSVQPTLGRTFTRADEQDTEPRVAILSHGFWQQALGANQTVVGQTARMAGRLVTIVGVMPASFDFPPRTDFWFPAPMLAVGMQQRPARFMRPIGLLRPGVSRAAAQADLNSIATHLADTYPDSNRGWTFSLQPMLDAIVGNVRPLLLLLLGAVGLILLIACVNIANLLLARNGTRVKELAIRGAIGAGRARLLRQLLTESFVLAALAAVVALPLAAWSVDVVRALAPQTLPRLNEIGIDGPVLAFAGLLSLLTALVFGIAPSWLATNASMPSHLSEGGRTGGSRWRRSVGTALIISETSLALCLLVAAALVIQSLWRIVHVSPGFSSSGVVTAHLSTGYTDAVRPIAFFERVFARIQSLPGVQAVGGIGELPLSGAANESYFQIVEHPRANVEDKLVAHWRITTPGYFDAMGIGVLRGRSFVEQDQASSPRVVIIDEPFAVRHFANENPIGKHLLIYEGSVGFVQREIVGVVCGVRHAALRLPANPTMYLPHKQSQRSDLYVVVRSAVDPGTLTGPIRQIVAEEDAAVAVPALETLDEVVSRSASRDRFTAWLFGLFGGLAVVLAAAGVFGVFSHIVTQQTREIGVRLALGASPAQVMRAVLDRGTRVALIGVSVGALAAFLLVHLLASQLYEITARDPATFVASALFLMMVGLVACFVPARRAARIDPMVALRNE